MVTFIDETPMKLKQNHETASQKAAFEVLQKFRSSILEVKKSKLPKAVIVKESNSLFQMIFINNLESISNNEIVVFEIFLKKILKDITYLLMANKN